MVAVDLPLPRRQGETGAAAVPVWVRVFDAGLACCAVEVSAALRRFAGLMPAAGPDTATPVHVLVVAGTVTDKLAPLVLRAYQELPEPRQVVSFGACSNSGGPYWDSYCVTKGVDQFVPVDVYVPGCPPRPEALLHGLGLLASGQHGSGVQQDSDARPGGDARQRGQG